MTERSQRAQHAWKQEASAANASRVSVDEQPGVNLKQYPGPTGSPADLERDDADTDALTASAAVAGVKQRGGDVPSTTERPRPGAAPPWETLALREQDFAKVEVGWSVISADGEQLGQVSRKGPNWIAVPYGVHDERTMYIPVTYIETVANKRIILNQPAGLVIDMKLDQPPAEFPGEYQRLGGVDHQPWRGSEPEAVAQPPEPDGQADGT